MRGIARYVEDLLRSRRPRRFQASTDDADLARASVILRAARPGGGAPREEFVTELHRRLATELDPPVPASAISRRRMFLRTASVAAGAAAVSAGVDHALTAGAPAAAPAPAATALIPQSGEWLTVAASADLPDGTIRHFTAGAVTVFIERSGGRLRAVSGICTHQGCLLSLADHPVRLVCPCHDATFTLDGAVLTHRLPVSLPALPRLEVRETEGRVQVYAPVPGHTL